MSSEKAAAEFQLEKEVKRLQEAQVSTRFMLHLFPPTLFPDILFNFEMYQLFKQLEAERNRVSRRASSSWEDDADMKTLEYVCPH